MNFNEGLPMSFTVGKKKEKYWSNLKKHVSEADILA